MKWKNVSPGDDEDTLPGGAALHWEVRTSQCVLSIQSKTQSGFTLIELLVVIGIIAVLAGLLLPALARAKGKALSIKCVSQFKQIGIATHMFADDNEDELPGNQHSLPLRPSWVAQLTKYLSYSMTDPTGGGIYRCPTEKKRVAYTCAVNDFLTFRPPNGSSSWPGLADFSRQGSIPVPAETLWMTELAEDIEYQDHFHFVDKSRSIPGEAAAYHPKSFLSQVH
ncbi:MAG TPA: prepilin-type N-terminal cleavage/methylation domain-containing protein, partial [Verrucomicrobiae bacterium]|nr:prepilin-type N-terminal cleavage/methylation domain-containing protein [Verrucomicrobiae bacterium]